MTAVRRSLARLTVAGAVAALSVATLAPAADATRWGAMYQRPEHPDEHLWADRAQVARIFAGDELGAWGDYPAFGRAYGDGIRHYVVSWRDTGLAHVRRFAASVPDGVRVWGVWWHEPEVDISRGRLSLADWKTNTVRQAAVMRQVGIVPTTILMGWTLFPQGRFDAADFDLPTGTVAVHAFDAHVRDKDPAVMARLLLAERRRSGLPLGIGETSGSPANLRVLRDAMNRPGVRWVASFTNQTGVNSRWTPRMNRAFYGGAA